VTSRRAPLAIAATVAGVLLVAGASLPHVTAPAGTTGGAPVPARPPAADDGDRSGVDPQLSLTSARIGTSSLDDELREQVEFCFTRRVRQPGDPHRLSLLGPDVDTRVTADTVELLLSDGRCLLARFREGSPVANYTMAAADAAAASDGTRSSVASVAALSGARSDEATEAGATSGPDLVSVAVQQTLDRLLLTFDEPLDEQAPVSPADFVY
jgi:hypothetical protein